MKGHVHPEVYLQFGKCDGTVGRSDLHCESNERGDVIAYWLYELGNIAVSVMFANSAGRWQNLSRAWHPHRASRKRLLIADFQYARRKSIGGEVKESQQ